MFVGAPNDADGSGTPGYSSGHGTRTHWGGGVQARLYYQGHDYWLGGMIKSPRWMELFQYNAEDELGRSVAQTVDVDLPMVISRGTAWLGWGYLVVAVDIRY